MNDNINDVIHPIRLEYEIARYNLEMATKDYEFTVKHARQHDKAALMSVTTYHNIYIDTKQQFEQCKNRFVSIGGKPTTSNTPNK